MKVYDYCCDERFVISVKEFFEVNGCNNWKDYYELLDSCSLYENEVYFEYEDIDRKVFVIDGGGELIRLKNGDFVNICWRGDVCRVWKEDDIERIEFFNKMLK